MINRYQIGLPYDPTLGQIPAGNKALRLQIALAVAHGPRLLQPA